jgi:hypothetical protein
MVLSLKNKSDDPVEILWEFCVYVDTRGRGHLGVVHGFDPFKGHPSIPPPTVVLPDSSITTSMLPHDHVIYVRTRGIDTWIPLSLLPRYHDKGRLEEVQSYIGQRVGVVLALVRRGRVERWHYEFEIQSAVVDRK